MEKQIKDYLPYYIGQDAAIKYDPKGISGMTIDRITGVSELGVSTSNGYLEKFEDVKPLLRPLSDMTEDEGYEILQRQNPYPVIAVNNEVETDRFISYRLQYPKRVSKKFHSFFPVTPQSAESVDYALKQGFALYGLIPAGLAIDKTKPQSNE